MWEEVGDQTELQNIDLASSSRHSIVSFSFSRVAQPEAQGSSPLLGAVFSTASFLQLSLISKTHWISCALSYITIQRPLKNKWPTEYVTSAVFGMACFDHHRAEITVMQFTGHPLPVHQFVTVPWDFNPVPYCQLSSPTPVEICNFRRLWNGIFGRVGGQYTTLFNINSFVCWLSNGSKHCSISLTIQLNISHLFTHS